MRSYINSSQTLEAYTDSPAYVAALLNRGGVYYSLGMRSYYLAVPLVFWLFGPDLMVLATAGLVTMLYHIDRAPYVLKHASQGAYPAATAPTPLRAAQADGTEREGTVYIYDRQRTAQETDRQ